LNIKPLWICFARLANNMSVANTITALSFLDAARLRGGAVFKSRHRARLVGRAVRRDLEEIRREIDIKYPTLRVWDDLEFTAQRNG